MTASTRRTALFATTGFAVILGVACGGGARLGSTTDFQMWVHFEQAGQIQAAMIEGDLTSAREAARVLAEAPAAADLGAEGADYAEQLASHAQTIRDAPTFGEAADATGLLAATCGNCHEAADYRPRFASSEPPEDRGFTGHMLAHSWAADRMWEGLLSASTASWLAGVDVFETDDPLHGGGLSPASDVFARRVHELAEQARDVVDLDERGRLYGQLLRQCSGCHAENGIR
ncbi:MAG: hypothetical protein KJO11_00500 [Gemmatimonadetes bacterium]|nr:hypothetical protein [Gemmatimonadota bacterium]MBT8402293.1 hypothetical protein [Gemmatimonadota bacterium]NNK63061.1 hypothetical protein [Gemmatimonadota bacterium]